MENWIKHINIHNFKSIMDLEIADCRRINLFIGYPNVGKSNVLEALGLFSVPFLKKGESLKKLVRTENHFELFHNWMNDKCEISADSRKITIKNEEEYLSLLLNDKSYYYFSDKNKLLNSQNIRNEVNRLLNEHSIKRYTFNPNSKWKSTGNSQLLPPFGENIIDTLSYNESVLDTKAWVRQEFAKFNLKLVLDKKNQSLQVQQNTNDEEVVLLLPYSSIADTLQRAIFYKTAIVSNKNAVLLFEEPEAHAFPPYIQTITQDIIDAETNQVFMVTHSPLVVKAFLEDEKLREETSIYLFDFKDNQTAVKRLSDEEMGLAYHHGDELFFNLEKLII